LHQKKKLYDLKRDEKGLKMRRRNSMHFTKTNKKILTDGKKKKVRILERCYSKAKKVRKSVIIPLV